MPCAAGSVTTSRIEARGRHRHARPLARADLEAEDPLREHRQHHDAGREHGLDDGERSEDEGGDVEQPGAERDAHADREPLGAEQRGAGAQRVPDVHRRRLVGAAVLVEEAELGCEGAAEREQDAESHVVRRKVWLCAATARRCCTGLSHRRVRLPWPVTYVIGPSPNLLEARCVTQTNVRDRERKRWPAHVARGRRRRGVPLRLRTHAPCRPGRDRSGWSTPLPLAPRRGVPEPPRSHVPVRLVHGLGGARGGASPAPARPPRRLAASHLPGRGGGSRTALEARRDRVMGRTRSTRSRGSTTPTTRAARRGRPRGPPRPCWCVRSPRPGSPRSTSRLLESWARRL